MKPTPKPPREPAPLLSPAWTAWIGARLGDLLRLAGVVALLAGALYLFGLALRVLWGAFRAGLGA